MPAPTPDDVCWGGEPDQPKRYYPKLSPIAGETIQAVILHARPVELLTHFDGIRNAIHYKDRRKCALCGAGLPVYKRGYFGCFSLPLSRCVICELSPGALIDLLDHPDSPEDYTTWTLILSRPGTKHNGRVIARVQPPTMLAQDLPPMFDLKAAILAIYLGRPKPTILDDSEDRR